MAMQMINLHIYPRGNPIERLPSEIAIPRTAPISELYQSIAEKSGLSVHRVRVTRGSDGQIVPNDQNVLTRHTGLLNGSKIYVKDLGPQISWQTVFIVEYMGPILIHPLLYFSRSFIYSHRLHSGPLSLASELQKLSLIVICLHYLKREIETVFVHRFSAATMPAQNIFKNSFHYWVLSGLFLAYFVYGPAATTAKSINPIVTSIGLLCYGAGQAGNLSAHLTLRALRSSGGKERGIPLGVAFKIVTCPNYMFETLSWVGVLLITCSWATCVFLLVSVAQMAVWARKKEHRYRREFGDKYKNRKYVILPGLY